jgi:hypothetical protein
MYDSGQEHDASSSVEHFKNKIHAVNLENWYPLLQVSNHHQRPSTSPVRL